ncbi:ATP-binding protein [uncultured Sulfitobacter sp.]|uniref:ATP-binding protein n=1 Tax=uncultured Sulfitobacter sp. TaxID=191468 RepID=UPI0026319623|nr:ATP-binding protein [uncultured Sulfitobacter sp.]
MLKPIELCLVNRDHGVRDALARLLVALGPLNLGAEERNTVELVLAEVLNNILEHAYPGIGPLGTVRISVEARSNGLHISVLDDGAPMPDGQAPLGTAQDLNMGIPDLPEGGFGWFLIRDLAKDVQYRRVAGHNQLDLRLAIALPRNH